MRTLTRCFLAALLLLPAPAAAQETSALHLIRYGTDHALRDRLIRECAVHADLGGAVVARLTPSAAASLRTSGLTTNDVPEPSAGEVMAAFQRQTADERPPAGRVLFADERHCLVAGPPAVVDSLRRPGLFHGGVAPIDLDRAYVPGAPVTVSLPLAADPKVTALVAQASKDELIRHVKALSDLHTRNATQTQNAAAIQYLLAELKKLPSVTVLTETFSASYGPNVIAELPGLETPDEIVMVGAHVDSRVSTAAARSPGADDNASGSAGVLELARVLAAAPLQRTVRFGWWNAEEFGLIGSTAYANKVKARGDKIQAYVNADMTAYRAASDTVDVDFILNDSTISLINTLIQITQTYVPALGTKTGNLSAGTSDHRSFFRVGYPAAFPFEDLDAYSPYIHSINDDMVSSANDMDLSLLITRSVLAGIATLAAPLGEPSFTLSLTKGPSVGGTLVTATGSFLASTKSVKVAGKTVAFDVVVGAVQFTTPTVDVLGPVVVEIANPSGSGQASFTYERTLPPALRLPATLKPGDGGPLAVGGEPGHVAAVLLSGLKGSTDLGLIVLDIGGGNAAQLFFFAVAGLGATGGTFETVLSVPNDPKLSGLDVHFQAVVLPPSVKPMAKTNVATLAIR